MPIDLADPIYNDDEKAREHLEAAVWPHGPVCPHCSARDGIAKLQGKSHRPGLYWCKSCKGQFTVTVGTVFERSKVPLRKWVLASHMLCASKKGMSAHQMHRMLGVTYKTAWFMMHRLREMMRQSPGDGLGGQGKVVEADETFFGRKDDAPKGRKRGGPRGNAHLRPVVSLVERGGHVRSFHVDRLNKATVTDILRRTARRESRLMTDESRLYTKVGGEYAGHGRVEHGGFIYVDRDDPTIHTNTIEGFFSIFKRGMKGIYQHCGEQHLHRYLAEFDFRYNHRAALGIDDFARAEIALAGIKGKRLTYRRPHAAA
jgi:transposase-like protein